MPDGNTPRELEIQKLATDVLPEIEALVNRHLGKLQDNMELVYYLKQITTRAEIIASMKFGCQ